MVPGPPTSASPGDLLEVQPHRKPTGPDTLGKEPMVYVLTSLWGDSDACSSLKTSALEQCSPVLVLGPLASGSPKGASRIGARKRENQPRFTPSVQHFPKSLILSITGDLIKRPMS